MKAGDRVRLSPCGFKNGFGDVNTVGTVTGFTKDGRSVYVWRDGTRLSTAFAPVIWETIPPKKVKIRYGWDGVGREGTLLTVVHVEQDWAVVKWDDEEDPDCFKLAGLETCPTESAHEARAAAEEGR